MGGDRYYAIRLHVLSCYSELGTVTILIADSAPGVTITLGALCRFRYGVYFPQSFFPLHRSSFWSIQGRTLAAGMGFAEYSSGFSQSMGISSSSFYLNDHPAGTMISRNYYLGTEVPTPQINIPPTGAIRASIADMSKYLRMVLAGGEADGSRIVTPQTLAAMLTRQNGNVPLDFDSSFGMTWFLSDAD